MLCPKKKSSTQKDSGKTVNNPATSGAKGGGGQVKVSFGGGRDIMMKTDPPNGQLAFDIHVNDFTKEVKSMFKQGSEDIDKVNVGSSWRLRTAQIRFSFKVLNYNLNKK